ncbi:hypothetical protein HanIR_Chr03g0130581 [Helianthus annuus]|nr:hypothetical protein HanIR_Chr03g0130581 [Helianthus annuus]KAJ0608674.1 hypothetical protein HanHA89_Chr03g0111681 [Helianthus annuus]
MTLYLIHFILIKPYTTLSADTPSSFPPIFSNPLTLSKQKENTDINLHLLQRNPSIHTERQSNAWPPSLSSPSRFLSTTQQEIQAFKHHPQPNNPTGGLANVYRLMVGAVLPTTTPPPLVLSHSMSKSDRLWLYSFNDNDDDDGCDRRWRREGGGAATPPRWCRAATAAIQRRRRRSVTDQAAPTKSSVFWFRVVVDTGLGSRCKLKPGMQTRLKYGVIQSDFSSGPNRSTKSAG